MIIEHHLKPSDERISNFANSKNTHHDEYFTMIEREVKEHQRFYLKIF